MGESFDRFLDELCWRRIHLTVIFFVASLLLVVQLPYLFVEEPGSDLFVVASINVVGFGLFALGSGAMLRYCARR